MESVTAEVRIDPIDVRVGVESVVSRWSAEGRRPAVLDSSRPTSPEGRYSIVADDPIDEYVLPSGDARCPFRGLAARAARWPRTVSPTELPFSGGWIGFVAYEAGLGIEGIIPTTRCDVRVPWARFCLFDTAAVYDHANRQWFAVAVEWPPGIRHRRPSAQDRIRRIRTDLTEVDSNESPAGHDVPLQCDARSNMTYREYAQKVARALRYLETGDIYQVNLSQRFGVRTDMTPVELYARLRRANPSDFGGLLGGDGFTVHSASPELFLRLRRGHVVTRPIKGTRPRGPDAASDLSLCRELATSEKDQAELAMIVDLLRNDLGRVCGFGTVLVTDPARIEVHPTVLHQVATIEAQLDERRTWVDLLRATFPGGSVTGAPKIRAMQIIDELEPTARGVYCGAIGVIGLDGSLTLNLAIRTLVQVPGFVYFHAGGAIVADSRADQEFDEINAKSAGMARALGCSMVEPRSHVLGKSGAL